MYIRYQDREVNEVLDIASLLDPRFKTLAHLSEDFQEKTFDSLKEAIMQLIDSSSTSSQKPAEVDLPGSAVTPPKKTKSNPLQKLLSNKFQSTISSGFSSTAATHDEIITSEISHYKAEKPVKLNENILLWWKARKDTYPNLSEVARYLGIVATSVPSERLFSVAGNTVNTKHAALDPSNVNKLVFPHTNMHLEYKHPKCSCVVCSRH